MSCVSVVLTVLGAPQPGVPHSYLWGHLPAIIKEAAALPPDCHPNEIMLRLVNKYNLRQQGCFVLDTYPISSDLQLVAVGQDVSAQITQGRQTFPKHPKFHHSAGLIGKRGLVLLEGAEWKAVRTLFNPGFSLGNIISMMPLIVEEGDVLALKLSMVAQKGSFLESFHDYARAVTFDIIGRAVLGLALNSQTRHNELGQGMEDLMLLMRPLATNFSWEHLNIWRMYKLVATERSVNGYLAKIVCDRWEQLDAKSEKTSASDAANSTLDLVLRKHRQALGPEGAKAPLSADFVSLMADK